MLKSRALTLARTLASLGLRNVASVVRYRLQLRAGIHQSQRLREVSIENGAFFRAVPARANYLRAPAIPKHFGWFAVFGDLPADWHTNPLNGKRSALDLLPWWQIPDFDASVGDVKAIWEASRFNWVITFAQQAVTGDIAAVARLNSWLVDWTTKNPQYRGFNWKCGQEASIRVLHLAVAALILRQVENPEPALVHLLVAHLRRIASTVAYATAQDNNHGTSEAAALMIGGSWLERAGMPEGARWHADGRTMLEERIAQLFDDDGTFSQYSINYHRLALDTLSVAELWRRRLGLTALNAVVYSRASAATEWLRSVTSSTNGDAPNIGANDGANLLPLTDADYRDHRPSVELASTLFLGGSAYPRVGTCQMHLRWLDVEPCVERLSPPISRCLDGGGFAVLRNSEAVAVLRYPRFRFRPSHADALHVDLMIEGENVLRDGGSYSYNAEEAAHAYFTGVASHNTVQFDDRDQMPRLGRFLFGDWLSTRSRSPLVEGADGTHISASYMDGHGAIHHRQVALRKGELTITDALEGFRRKAVLRWRLLPGSWQLKDGGISDGVHSMTIDSTMAVVRYELIKGWESRYYLRREMIPVLEVEVREPGQIVSRFQWSL